MVMKRQENNNTNQDNDSRSCHGHSGVEDADDTEADERAHG